MADEEHRPRRGPRFPKAGRPRTPADLESLVVRLGNENGWGYTRILGELKKLGMKKLSRSTVVNILKRNGLSTGPGRAEGTWGELLKIHAQTLWACDYFSKKVLTPKGMRRFYVLFFLHVETRMVRGAGMTN